MCEITAKEQLAFAQRDYVMFTLSNATLLARTSGVVVTCLGLMLAAPPARAEVDPALTRHTRGSTATVDHKSFDALLKAHVMPNPDGLNRVDYKAFKAAGHASLKGYVANLEKVDVAKLDRPEQFAYWANLYNAKTLDIVLDKYPVKSIKDISLGGGLLAAVTGGPWKAKTMRVMGRDLSLDDIEHGILRPTFKDPRVHYSVNCASVGCPNLGTEAFTGAKLEAQLDAAAKAFVNSPRGFQLSAGKVTASSIYSWFQVDFGASVAGVLEHARRHAEPALKQKLEGITGVAEFAYDWSLNDTNR